MRDVGEDQLERISQIKEDFEKNDVYAMSLDAAYNKAKSGEIELCFLRHQGMTTKRIGKSALKRMFKSQELCYSIGEAGRRFLR